MNIDEFFDQIKPSIKWNDAIGFHLCNGCGRQMDSTEKLSHWPKYCSLSKDKKLQKLRDQVLAENFPEEKPVFKEVGLDWYHKQIKNNARLPIESKGTGLPIHGYPPIKLLPLTKETIEHLRKLFSGEIKCVKKEVKTGDDIIDSIDYEKEMFSSHLWVKNHYSAILEAHKLGIRADLNKKGICDIPDCFCHELAAMKNTATKMEKTRHEN